jgi:hypothetical protein
MPGEVSHYSLSNSANLPSWDPSAIGTIPSGWTFNVTAPNESVLLNDMYSQGTRPVADVLLNIVESNQALPSLQSIASYLPLLKQNWRSIRKVIKVSSSSYLAWKFGIGPLISDLRSIAKFGPDMKKRFDIYASDKKIRVARSIPCTMTFSKSDFVAQVKNGQNVIKDSYQGLLTGSPTLRYVMVLEPSQRYKTPVFQKLDFLLKRFTTSPAELAWELIPYSFVLDWMFDVRSALHEVDRVLGFNPYNVVSISKSVSYAVTTQMFIRGTTSCSSPVVLFDKLLAEEEIKSYERTPLSRPGIIPSLNGRFGKNQAALSAALIAQNIFKSVHVPLKLT